MQIKGGKNTSLPILHLEVSPTVLNDAYFQEKCACHRLHVFTLPTLPMQFLPLPQIIVRNGEVISSLIERSQIMVTGRQLACLLII